jgi:uncharacterized protein YbaR (Trm112 family)
VPEFRYCDRSSELVNRELGVAYPVIDGIPVLIARKGRVIED